jgi:hypothetical protein
MSTSFVLFCLLLPVEGGGMLLHAHALESVHARWF